MSTITATQQYKTQFTEAFTEAELPGVSAGNRSLTYDTFNKTVQLSPTSTPPATKAWTGELTGNQTLDFTAMARTVGADVNATGLKLQAILLNNLSATVAVVVAKGAVNGYAFNGAAGDKTIVPAGSWQEYFADALADIDATHKTLDITATGDYQIVMLFG